MVVPFRVTILLATTNETPPDEEAEMKTIVRVALVLATTLLAGRIANAELVIRFSRVVRPQTPKGRAADLFA